MVFGFFKDLKYASSVRNIIENECGEKEAARIFDLDWVVTGCDGARKNNWTADATAIFILSRINYEPKSYEETLLHKELNSSLEKVGMNWRMLNPEMYWKLVGLTIKSEDPNYAIEWLIQTILKAKNMSAGSVETLRIFRDEFDCEMKNYD